MRDRQRSRLYRWEERVVAPRDRTGIPFVQIKPMVDALWQDLGLRYPPMVERLPGRASRRMADATRFRLRVQDPIPSWVLLHELAHVLSSTAGGESDGHGPAFVGLYLQLLTRYLRIPLQDLADSMTEAGIAFDLAARPSILDPL